MMHETRFHNAAQHPHEDKTTIRNNSEDDVVCSDALKTKRRARSMWFSRISNEERNAIVIVTERSSLCSNSNDILSKRLTHLKQIRLVARTSLRTSFLECQDRWGRSSSFHVRNSPETHCMRHMDACALCRGAG